MFGFTKFVRDSGQRPIAKLTEAELKNVLEQERIVRNAIQVHRMLVATLDGTMRKLAQEYSLPDLFELDRKTGEVFPKESSDG